MISLVAFDLDQLQAKPADALKGMMEALQQLGLQTAVICHDDKTTDDQVVQQLLDWSILGLVDAIITTRDLRSIGHPRSEPWLQLSLQTGVDPHDILAITDWHSIVAQSYINNDQWAIDDLVTDMNSYCSVSRQFGQTESTTPK